MNRWTKRCMAFVLTLTIMCTSISAVKPTVETTYAATVQNITKSTTVVCRKTVAVKAPSGYKNCKYSSTNPKVASIDAKGKLKALRLGITTITVKSGTKKKSYTITVVPEKKSDVRLNQELILGGQMVQLKLVSDKYDTSQVKLYVDSAFKEIDHRGNCNFKKYNDSLQWEFLGKSFHYKQLKNKGIEIQMDGSALPDQIVYTPGDHTYTVIAGKEIYSKKIGVSYSVKDTLIKKDARGYTEDGKAVFDAAFAAVDQVVKDGMGEEEKVKAIHDYLIYHANYVNNGDYSTAENWAYGAGGVLLHKEGVCQSYAFAFYMMAISAGLECRFVSGTADGGGHAWNQVKVNGKWYYIDCTWDDPVGGGYENYKYYLSESLWADHIAETAKDLSEDGKYDWEHYYLTGADYAR